MNTATKGLDLRIAVPPKLIRGQVYFQKCKKTSYERIYYHAGLHDSNLFALGMNTLMINMYVYFEVPVFAFF